MSEEHHDARNKGMEKRKKMHLCQCMTWVTDRGKSCSGQLGFFWVTVSQIKTLPFYLQFRLGQAGRRAGGCAPPPGFAATGGPTAGTGASGAPKPPEESHNHWGTCSSGGGDTLQPGDPAPALSQSHKRGTETTRGSKRHRGVQKSLEGPEATTGVPKPQGGPEITRGSQSHEGEGS